MEKSWNCVFEFLWEPCLKKSGFESMLNQGFVCDVFYLSFVSFM